MIAIAEPFDYASEITFTLPSVDDPLVGVTGMGSATPWTDAGDGTTAQVQLMLPGEVAFSNATIARIVEKGYGRYAVRLTLAQRLLGGNAYIRANVAGAQPFFDVEVIGRGGGDIAVNDDGVFPFYLPNVDDPIYGAPVSAYDFGAGPTTPLVRLCLPNGAYGDANVADIVNIGFGGWGLKLAAAAGQTAQRGKAFLYANVPGAQRFEGYITILGVSGTSTVVATPSSTPASASTRVTAVITDQVAEAIARLPQQFRS